MPSNTLRLRVIEREGIVFDGKVASITSENTKGKFDVLSNHSNFISILTGDVIINDEQGEPRQIAAQNAVMKVSSNIVNVYIGIKKTA